MILLVNAAVLHCRFHHFEYIIKIINANLATITGMMLIVTFRSGLFAKTQLKTHAKTVSKN